MENRDSGSGVHDIEGKQGMRHILSVDQFDRPFIDRVMATAHRYQSFSRQEMSGVLNNSVLANLFYEPSTRTSSSFHAAMTKLGGSVIPINDVTYSSVSKGENLEDTIRTMGAYADVIVLRHPQVGSAERAAKVSPVPIINAGDGVGEHPTQALLDLYTIQQEQGRIDGLTITLVGDLKHGRTVHSLAKILRHYDVKLNFVAPPGLAMPEEFVREGDVQYFSGLEPVMHESDIIYMTRLQSERLDPSSSVGTYGIDASDMQIAKPTMSLMHPLPRVNEIDPAIDSDRRAAYFRQVKNGMFVRMALLAMVLSKK